MKKILLILASALLLGACHDYRNDYLLQYDEQVYIRPDASPVRNCSALSERELVGIIKAGKGIKNAGTVRVTVSHTALVKYNEENGTRFVPVPDYVFLLDGQPAREGKAFSFDLAEGRCLLEVTWKADRMVDLLSSGKDDYVIPLYLSDSDIPVNRERDLLLLHPVLPE